MLNSFFSMFQNLELFTVFWLIEHDIVKFLTVSIWILVNLNTHLCICESNLVVLAIVFLMLSSCQKWFDAILYIIFFHKFSHIAADYSYFWAYLIFLIFYFSLKSLFSMKKMILNHNRKFWLTIKLHSVAETDIWNKSVDV